MTRSARIEILEDGVVVRTLDIPILNPHRATEVEVKYDDDDDVWRRGVVRHRAIESVSLTFYPLCDADGTATTVKEYPRND